MFTTTAAPTPAGFRLSGAVDAAVVAGLPLAASFAAAFDGARS